MKKSILITLVFMLSVVTANAQGFGFGHMPKFDKAFPIIEGLVIENVPVTFPTEDEDYLISLPRARRLVIAYDINKSTAKILRGAPNRNRVYNVDDNEVRLTLWYKDEHIYCGYVYDKKAKAGNYFEAIDASEKEKLVEKLPFLNRIPTFN